MARVSKNRQRNPYIIIFWEGESEEQYLKFLKNRFHDKANLTINKKKGIFDAAKKAFSSKGEFVDDLLDVDEIWFVFDTETDMRPGWKENYKIIKTLRKKCKNASIKLYMTKGCIEYFFLLHYEKMRPLIISPADKEKVRKKLELVHCPGYKKGDKETTWKIAEHYETAIENGEWSLKQIKSEWEQASDEDDRMRILYFTDSTFTNAHEAVQYLSNLKKNV